MAINVAKTATFNGLAGRFKIAQASGIPHSAPTVPGITRAKPKPNPVAVQMTKRDCHESDFGWPLKRDWCWFVFNVAKVYNNRENSNDSFGRCPRTFVSGSRDYINYASKVHAVPDCLSRR
jgi:hypothetical protein